MRREVQARRICARTERVPGFPEQQELCLVTAKATKFCSSVQAAQPMLFAGKGSGVLVEGIATTLPRCLINN